MLFCAAASRAVGERISVTDAPADPCGNLLTEFREFGAVGARVQLDRATGRSRGFGFVMFADEKGLRDAIAAMDKTDVDGRRISVTRAIPQNETAPGTPAAALQRGSRGGGGGTSQFPMVLNCTSFCILLIIEQGIISTASILHRWAFLPFERSVMSCACQHLHANVMQASGMVVAGIAAAVAAAAAATAAARQVAMAAGIAT